jgi:MoxR-like ATPase
MGQASQQAPTQESQRLILALKDNIARVLLGHDDAIERLLCCLLARGHVLIEDVPGVGKTVLATSVARSLDCSFSRMQLTPDTLPGDVLGVSVYDKNTSEFIYKQGPIFANIVLADEINRTPPRTQSALLEAMAEGTVSEGGRVYSLPRPFLLIATQNPYEFDGTYPLPENQLDRFLMRMSIGYPAPQDEARVLSQRPGMRTLSELRPVLHATQLVALQEAVDNVHASPAVVQYIVQLANASRRHEGLIHGISPRGSLALAQASRARALMQGRGFITPEDVLAVIEPVCSHRIIARGAMPGSNATVQALREVVASVASPA